MSFDPSFEEQALLVETAGRRTERSTRRELLAGAVAAAAFVACEAAVWVAQPPRAFALLPAVVCVLVLFAAMMVRFDTPFGFTDATQLAFVPLVFALPLALVPGVIAIALGLSWLPEVGRGELRPARLLQVPWNSFFALGPVVVLVLAHVEPDRAGPIILIAALAGQIVLDFCASSLHHLTVRRATFSSLLHRDWIYGIDGALACIGLVVAKDIHATPFAALFLFPLLGLLAVFAHERGRRVESMLELSSAYRGTALVLGDVIEADDGYTGEHCKSVVSLCLELADHLGLSAEQHRNLEFAALLHDVGKIAIPKEIINKPGKLDPHEWTIIKTHTLEGQKMLERVGGFMREVGMIVRSHHERWDGGGYPDGLTGEQIPLEARIVSVCDTWNAMRTDRPYRNALAVDVSLAELLSNAGKQFDPMVVDTFVRLVVPGAEPGAIATGALALAPAPPRSTPALIPGAAES